MHLKAGLGQRPQGGQGGNGFPPHFGQTFTSGHFGQTGGTISDFKIYASSFWRLDLLSKPSFNTNPKLELSKNESKDY